MNKFWTITNKNYTLLNTSTKVCLHTNAIAHVHTQYTHIMYNTQYAMHSY